jgi:hypothetical protein
MITRMRLMMMMGAETASFAMGDGENRRGTVQLRLI